MPQIKTAACSPQYIQCERGAEFQLNSIPFTWNEGICELYFPRPFLIIGLCNLWNEPASAMENGEPFWPRSLSEFASPGQQAVYSSLTPTLMIELALATMYEYDPSAPVNYVRPGIQATNYRGYFNKFLNDSVQGEPRQWFNTFIQPGSLFKNFADLNAALANVDWFDKFLKFITYLHRTSDQRLYGSPGVYSVQLTTGQTEWTLDNSYERVFGG